MSDRETGDHDGQVRPRMSGRPKPDARHRRQPREQPQRPRWRCTETGCPTGGHWQAVDAHQDPTEAFHAHACAPVAVAS